jgi:hypothetical protein
MRADGPPRRRRLAGVASHGGGGAPRIGMGTTLRVAAAIAALSVAAARGADPEPADPQDPSVPRASAPPVAPAVPAAPVVRMRLRGGQELTGRLVHQDLGGVVVELPGGGRVAVPAEAIERIEEDRFATIVNGEIWAEDRNRTRYLYAPSAFMLRRGERYFSQKELFFSAFGFGLTDHLTVLVGTVVPAWFAPEGVNFIAAAKAGGAVTDWLHLAAGAETFVLPAFGGGGFAFAAATVGGPSAHLTVAAGPPFLFGSGHAAIGDAIVVVSGNVRVGPSVALVTENWLFPTGRVDGELPMVNGFALRVLGARAAVDVGVVRVAGANVPVPWIDFTWNFER